MDADSSRLRPHSKTLIHRIRKFPFETNGSRRDIICRFRPGRNAKKAELLSEKNKCSPNICTNKMIHDIMSVSEWEQTKCAHHERRMAIMNEVHDIIMYANEEMRSIFK